LQTSISGTNSSRLVEGHVSNSGRIAVGAGVSGQFSRSGANVQNSGLITVGTGGTMSFPGSGIKTLANLSGGVIGGTGTVNLSNDVVFTNAGTISPGSVVTLPGLAAGELRFVGGVALGDAGELRIELGGTTLGSTYDVLTVTGDVRLDGDLTVASLNGFVPDGDDSFTVLRTLGTGNTIGGVFDNTAGNVLSVPLFGTFEVSYNATSVVLTNFVPAVVPEPAGLGVLAGGALLGLRRRR
jgi:hypothetical protein